MPRMPLIHPELKKRIPEQYPDECTIQQREEGTNDFGEPVDEWVDLEGHVDISALKASTGGREIKKEDQTYTIAEYHISLKGYYPDIEENMRAVVNGINHSILLVEHASRNDRTRLAVEVVE